MYNFNLVTLEEILRFMHKVKWHNFNNPFWTESVISEKHCDHTCRRLCAAEKERCVN